MVDMCSEGKSTKTLLVKVNLPRAIKNQAEYEPAIPLLRIYLKACDSGYYKTTCTPMFITALFTIDKLWKQPRCPTTDK
jgi:hypothetical protein